MEPTSLGTTTRSAAESTLSARGSAHEGNALRTTCPLLTLGPIDKPQVAPAARALSFTGGYDENLRGASICHLCLIVDR